MGGPAAIGSPGDAISSSPLPLSDAGQERPVNPAPGPAPVVLPPASPAVEPGRGTSEWAALKLYGYQLAAVATGLVVTVAVAKLGLHLPDAALQLIVQSIVQMEFAVGGLVVSYVIGRSIRKRGIQ